MDIQNSLINLRSFFELTQTDVANICGVTVSAVCHWEHGRSLPRYKHIQALADHLGIPADSIITSEQLNDLGGGEELLALFNSMSDEGQSALLAAARGMANAYPKNKGMVQSA